MATHTDPAVHVVKLPATLRNLAELAALLERIEQGGTTPDAQQYLALVEGIGAELRLHAQDPGLDTLLACFAGTAEVYENLSYAAAGLCRMPLEDSVESEKQARALLLTIAKGTPGKD